MCIRDRDIPIILLTAADSDDYEFIAHAVPVGQEYEYGTSGSEGSLGTATLFEDWGFVSGGIGGALQLGPLKRQIDQQKFNKEGGFSKSNYLQGGSGYTLGTITVIVVGGGGTGAVLTPILGSAETYNGTVTGAVTGFTVANAGAGYTGTPTVTITDSGSGSGAVVKAIVNITTGKVTGGYVLQESHASLMRDGIKRTPDSGTLTGNIISGGINDFYTNNFEDLGGGYTIQHFQDAKISTYITNRNEKTRIVMNSDITLV